MKRESINNYVHKLSIFNIISKYKTLDSIKILNTKHLPVRSKLTDIDENEVITGSQTVVFSAT